MSYPVTILLNLFINSPYYTGISMEELLKIKAEIN